MDKWGKPSLRTGQTMEEHDNNHRLVQSRTDDWVLEHSGPPHMPLITQSHLSGTTQTCQNATGPVKRDLRTKAQRMMDRKKQSQPDFTVPELAEEGTQPMLGSCPDRGVSHLKKLQLVPDNFRGNRTQADEEEMEQNKSKCNPIFNTEVTELRQVKDCACPKAQIKSGKFAKTNITIQKQEIWLHTAISKKYARRTTFDNLEFEAFVAGEAKIILHLLNSGEPIQGRLQVLSLIADWLCRCKHWPTVRGLYGSIIEEIELGKRSWDDDFSNYEAMLSSCQVNHDNGNHIERGRKEVYWCKNFQVGTHKQNPPHMAQLKNDEPPVPVVHICVHCWSTSHKRKDHMEMDCPLKK